MFITIIIITTSKMIYLSELFILILFLYINGGKKSVLFKFVLYTNIMHQLQ